MSESAKRLEIASAEGDAWMEKSLAAGFAVSTAVLASAPFPGGQFHTFVPAGIEPNEVLFPDAPDIPSEVANAGLAEYLDQLTKHGASCVIVEDDLAERDDPLVDKWPIPSGFIDNRLIHWFELEFGSGRDVVEAMRRFGASHWLNAFVVSRSAKSFELLDQQVVAEKVVSQIPAALIAVIVFAFDETSFLVWDRVDA